jgi:ABC-type iron transport system FetAB permease component
VKHSFLWIAILLVIIWFVARVVLAVTSVALHLLWVLAIIAAVIWFIGRASNRT